MVEGGEQVKNRIKQIRKHYNLNQEDFGKRIGAKQSTVTAYECGNRVPMDVTITSICREFGVNEEWLRTGKGEMLMPKSRGQEIGEIVQSASKNDPEEAVKFFTNLLEDMSDAEIMLMYEIFTRHFPGK